VIHRGVVSVAQPSATPTLFRVLIFFISNELINEHKKFSDCVEKLDIKCDGGGAEKIQRRRDWSVVFDSMKIRLGKSAKFDGAGV